MNSPKDNLSCNAVANKDAEINELKKRNQTLKANISTLYKTAKAEIDRKDKRISALQSQLDDLIFKRKNVNQQ